MLIKCTSLLDLLSLYAIIEDGTMEKEELREARKQMFAQMEQRLQEMHPKEGDRMFYYHSSEDFPCIIAVPYQGTLNLGDDTASVHEGKD